MYFYDGIDYDFVDLSDHNVGLSENNHTDKKLDILL